MEFYNYDPTTAGDMIQLNSHGYSFTTGSVALATSAKSSSTNQFR